MTIGERIKNRRKELGLSVEEVAKRLGKNRATIYRYESDYIESLPSPILEPLADVLQTTPAYLMGWENEQNENALDDAKSVEELLKEKKTKEKWDAILDELSQENKDRLQEQAELLLLKQQVQADQEGK